MPLPKKQATSLSGIKTPAGAHWSAALCHRLPDLSSVLSSRPLNNKCCVVKVPPQVLIIVEVSGFQNRGGWLGPLGEPARLFSRIHQQEQRKIGEVRKTGEVRRET